MRKFVCSKQKKGNVERIKNEVLSQREQRQALAPSCKSLVIIIGFIFAFYHSSINCKAERVILSGILEKAGREPHTMQAEPLSTTAC